jgi:murein L,D-transpeptidase YcbB/YkuD
MMPHDVIVRSARLRSSPVPPPRRRPPLSLATIVLIGALSACDSPDRLPSGRAGDLAADARGSRSALAADSAPATAVASALEQALFSQSPPAAAPAEEWALLRRLYERRRHAALWVTDEARRAAAVGALCGAGAHGLAAASYLPRDLVALVHRAGGPADALPLADDELAQLDFRLSGALLASARDLLAGRVPPSTISPAWRLAPSRAALDSQVIAAFDSADPAMMLEGLHAPYDGHAELLGAWRRYRDVAAAGGWPEIPAGATLAPGRSDGRVPLLRRRLRDAGDFAGDTLSERYDTALAAAVRRFQRRQGLEADGVVGSTTLERLNVAVQQRMLQLEANLERFRWLPGTAAGRHLLIDLGAGRLTAHAAAAQTGAIALTVPRDAAPAAPAAPDSARPLPALQPPVPPYAVADSIRAVELVPGTDAAPARLRLLLAGDSTGYLLAAERRRNGNGAAVLPARAVATTPALADAALLVLRGETGWDSTRVAAALRGTEPTRVPVTGLALYLLRPTVAVREGAVHLLDDATGVDARLAELLRPSATLTPPPAVCRSR